MSWSPYLNGFKAYLLLERALADRTIEAYLRDVAKLPDFLALREKNTAVDQVSTSDLCDFLQYLLELGLGARSQARLLSSLKAFFRYLLLEDIITVDPAQDLESPRLPRHLPTVLSVEEMRALLGAIDLSHPQGTRNRAMLETLYACGLRVSELIQLRMNDLYLSDQFVRVIGKGDKERIVPIGAVALKHIQYYLDHERRGHITPAVGHEHLLFLNRRGKGLSRVMVFNIVKAAARDAGIEKNVSPHTFRHSFATHLIEGGAGLKAVQDMLGHASILTTEIYTHLDTDFLRATIMQYHPRA